MADDGREDLIPPDRQTFEIGGRYREGEQLDAARARSLARALRPGDIVQVETGTTRGPTGDMRVIDAQPPSGEGAVLVPENGSREYLLVPGNADVRVDSSVVPIRLRVRGSGESVGAVGGITVDAGGSPTAPDTTTATEPEQGGMSGSPARRQVEQRYDTIGTTEATVMENIRSLDLPTALDGYDGIGEVTADVLNDNGIESPADLAVTVRGEQSEDPAFGPLQRALESINAQQGRAVLDAARTLRDLSLPETESAGGAASGMGAFPVEAVASWDGEEIQFSFIDSEQTAKTALDGETVSSLRETLKLMYMDDADTGEPVADVTFTEPDEYDVDKRFDPIELLDPEEFDTSGFSVSDGPPSRAPDVLVAAPDNTRIEIYDTSVYAYPSSTSVETKLVDATRATEMNVTPEQVLDRVEQKEGFRIVRDNRPERESAANAAGTADVKDRTDPESDETRASESGSEDPTALGFTEAEIAAAMESVMVGTDAVVDIDGSEITVGWQARDDAPAEFNRDSAVITGEVSLLESLARQVTKAYYDNAALSADTVDAIESAVESAPIEFPEPPTVGSRADASTSDGSGGGPTDASSSVFSTDAVRKVEQRIQQLLPSDSGAAPRGISDRDVQDALEPIESEVVDETDGLVRGLGAEQQSNPSGVWVGTTVSPVFASAAGERIPAVSLFDPIDISVGIGDEVSRLEDLVRWVEVLDVETDQSPEVSARLPTIRDATDDKFRRGEVDMDTMFLSGSMVKSFAQYLPETYDVSLLSHMASVDTTYALAQQAYAADTAPDTFLAPFRDEVRSFAAGSSRGAVGQEALQQVEDNTFDPVDFSREFWRVAEGGRTRGDIIDQTRRESRQAQSALEKDPTDEYLDQPGGVEVIFTRDPGNGRFGIEVEVAQTGDTLDSENARVETALLFLDSEVDADDYQPGTTIGEGTISGSDLESFTISPPDGNLSPDTSPPDPPQPDPTPEPEKERSASTQTPGSTPGDVPSSGSSTPPPRTASDSDETTIGEATIDTLDTESVTIEELDVDIGGDVSIGVDDLDVETVESIEENIEEDIGG